MIVKRLNDMLPFLIALLLLVLLYVYIDRLFLLVFELSEPLSKYIP